MWAGSRGWPLSSQPLDRLGEASVHRQESFPKGPGRFATAPPTAPPQPLPPRARFRLSAGRRRWRAESREAMLPRHAGLTRSFSGPRTRAGSGGGAAELQGVRRTRPSGVRGLRGRARTVCSERPTNLTELKGRAGVTSVGIVTLLLIALRVCLHERLWRLLVSMTLGVTILLQLPPAVLWFVFNGEIIGDSPFEGPLGHWLWSVPHILLVIVSAYAICLLELPRFGGQPKARTQPSVTPPVR